MKHINYFLVILFFTAGSLFAQTKWNFDDSHTNVGFEVDHMLITTVEGEFNKYEGTVTTDGESFKDAKINFTIDVASINTDNEKRDNHLKSDDFFNAEKFPKITFKGKSMEQVEGNDWKLVGDLTIRDVTKEVELDVDFKGQVQGPWGNTRVGFDISGVINRFDYNLKWNKVLEAGGLVVGEDVTINIDVQLIKEK
jgi:polyisoprenoid-binding protein YceI